MVPASSVWISATRFAANGARRKARAPASRRSASSTAAPETASGMILTVATMRPASTGSYAPSVASVMPGSTALTASTTARSGRNSPASPAKKLTRPVAAGPAADPAASQRLGEPRRRLVLGHVAGLEPGGDDAAVPGLGAAPRRRRPEGSCPSSGGARRPSANARGSRLPPPRPRPRRRSCRLGLATPLGEHLALAEGFDDRGEDGDGDLARRRGADVGADRRLDPVDRDLRDARRLQPLDAPCMRLPAAKRADVEAAGPERRDQRPVVDLRVVGDDAERGIGVERAAPSGHPPAIRRGGRRPGKRSGVAKAVRGSMISMS